MVEESQGDRVLRADPTSLIGRETALRALLRGTKTHVRVSSDAAVFDVEAKDTEATEYVGILLDGKAWHAWMAGAPFAEVVEPRHVVAGVMPDALRGWR